jgi:signal transduction histidine kinase
VVSQVSAWSGPPWRRGQPPPLLRDVIPALLLAAVLTGVTTAQVRAASSGPPLGVAGYALIEGAALSLALRRRWALLAYGLSTACSAGFLLAGFPPGPLIVAPFVALLAVMVRTPSPLQAAAALIGGGVLASAHAVRYGWSGDTAIFVAVWLGLATLAGLGLGARQRYLAEVRARSRWAERSREEESRRHMAEERLRIAREMHDVLGHSLAVITLQAGVAEHLLDSRPDEVRRAVTAIRNVSKQALAELRSELAMLRGEGQNGAERTPTPDVSALPSLVAQMRDAGLRVDLDLEASVHDLPEIVSRAAYRLVQESLTNVARHAGSSATAAVSARVEDGALRIEIIDDGVGAAALQDGAGIEGMRERVAALGGSFSAANRDHRGFAVTASLPVQR